MIPSTSIQKNKIHLIEKEYDNVMTSYWFWADQFLLSSQKNEEDNWLYNNFINLWYNPEWFPGGIFFANNGYRGKMVEFYDCPYINMEKIFFDENKMIQSEDIVSFIIRKIREERFVLLMVDRHYLNDRKFDIYNEHQILVHGMDFDKQEFYYADNNDIGKFSTSFTCSFSELKNAFQSASEYENEPDFSDSVFTFTSIRNDDYPLKLNKILHNIKQYRNSERLDSDSNNCFGFQVYDDLIDYFNHELKSRRKFNINMRGLCALHDHKKAMVARLQHIEKKYNVKLSSLDRFVEVEHNFNIIVNLYIKIAFVEKKEHHERLIEHIIQTRDLEAIALDQLIEELEAILH